MIEHDRALHRNSPEATATVGSYDRALDKEIIGNLQHSWFW